MTRTIREEFDRSREFVVFKPMLMGKKLLTRGDPFDKTKVTVRRLRQLYDQYAIIFANKSNGGVLPPKSPASSREGKQLYVPPRSASHLEDDVTEYLASQPSQIQTHKIQTNGVNTNGKAHKEGHQENSYTIQEAGQGEEAQGTEVAALLNKVKITGPGVNALDNRKEVGSKTDTEKEVNEILRKRSLERVKSKIPRVSLNTLRSNPE